MAKSAFGPVFTTFRNALMALRVFSDQIAKHADEHDRKILLEFARTLADLIGPKPDTDGAQEPPHDQLSESGTSAAGSSDEEDIDERVQVILSDDAKRKQFVTALRSARRGSPQQGDILRRGAIITLISHLEALIADLIHSFYTAYPEALPAEERTLTLAELREFGSLADAEQSLVAKEVDAVLRDSLELQLRYFGKRPKLALDALDAILADLIEVDQRRNLYVHNRGVVNRLYLKKVGSEVAARMHAEEGKALRTDDEYLSSAIDTVFIVGVILSQLSWRKWHKDSVAAADAELIEVVFEALSDQRYTVVDKVALFAEKLPFHSDENRRIVIINHAIACRDTERKEAMEAVLSKCDWSACGLRFRIALAALRSDVDEVWRLVTRAAASEEIQRDDLEQWPLFRNIREQSDFASRLSAIAFPTASSATGVDGGIVDAAEPVSNGTRRLAEPPGAGSDSARTTRD